jgi:hypothetical protein
MGQYTPRHSYAKPVAYKTGLAKKPAFSDEPRVRFQPIETEVRDRSLRIETLQDDSMGIENAGNVVHASFELFPRHKSIQSGIHVNDLLYQ